MLDYIIIRRELPICYNKCDEHLRKLELSLNSLRNARKFLPVPPDWALSKFKKISDG